MCVEIKNVTMEYNTNNNTNNNKKMSYSLKKVLKAIFKKQTSEKKVKTQEIFKHKSSMESLESLESLENMRNAEAEMQSENEANERIYAASSSRSSIASEDHYNEAAIYVPVHFARTANGTFFWTAVSDIAPDADLMEPLDCCTDNQIAVPQCGDRWAQA